MKKLILWILTFAWGYLIFYLTSIPNLKISENDLVSFTISNGSHFGYFGVLAILLYFALPATILAIKSDIAAISLTSIYGILDELHQIKVPGRTADPLDWLVDTLGAIFFLAILNKVIIKYKIHL